MKKTFEGKQFLDNMKKLNLKKMQLFNDNIILQETNILYQKIHGVLY